MSPFKTKTTIYPLKSKLRLGSSKLKISNQLMQIKSNRKFTLTLKHCMFLIKLMMLVFKSDKTLSQCRLNNDNRPDKKYTYLVSKRKEKIVQNIMKIIESYISEINWTYHLRCKNKTIGYCC